MGNCLHAESVKGRLIEIREATLEDCQAVSKDLRIADELEATCRGLSPETACVLSWQVSLEAYCASFDGVPVVLFGVGPKGTAWLVSTPEVEETPLTFFKTFKVWWSFFLRKYRRLWNLIHRENDLHIEMLKRLGASFEPYNPDFLKFTAEWRQPE